MGCEGCCKCLRISSQLILIITNVIVAVIGLGVMGFGIWAKVNSKEFYDIADGDKNFTQVSVLLIVVGIFVAIIGVVGSVGACFANFIFGRFTLGLYAVVLGLLVLVEIGGGIAAAVKKDDIEELFRTSSNKTFLQYLEDSTKQDTWDRFQQSVKCCGVDSYLDYVELFDNETVPESCCNKSTTAAPGTPECEFFRNVTNETLDGNYIYVEGCVNVVIDTLKDNLGAVSGVAIGLGILQIVAIIVACFVAVSRTTRDENSYEPI